MNNNYTNAEAQNWLGALGTLGSQSNCGVQQNNTFMPLTEHMAYTPAKFTPATTPLQTAQGAAIEGVYHPPVLPWEGHNEDVLFTSDVALEHSSMWPSERAVIWAFIVISLGLSIAAILA